jgi:hypothetical protein
MSEVPILSLNTWNIAANDQVQRIGRIADYLAGQNPGVTILTELTAIEELKKALNREVGPDYSLATINTGCRWYEDNIGMLVTGKNYAVTDEPEAVPTYGRKMPYVMRAHLMTPLGEVSLVGMRGAYIAGRGTPLNLAIGERQAQFKTAAEAAKEGHDIAFIGGDMNAFAHTQNRAFRRSGFKRLSSRQNTWPDREGNSSTTLDARFMSLPFILTRSGLALDAIFGYGPVEAIGSIVDATDISDHMHLKTVVTNAPKETVVTKAP